MNCRGKHQVSLNVEICDQFLPQVFVLRFLDRINIFEFPMDSWHFYSFYSNEG